MDPKSNVVKSKSSNSAITTKSNKSDNQNKKTRSSAEFQRQTKKRGVYVEKKPTKLAINTSGTKNAVPKQKPPPRPRPGKKRFLSSVLTILSKSTTGTQYPDVDDTTRKPFKRLPKKTRNEPPKRKFKSKVLRREEDNRRSDKEQLVVLQAKKDIIQTPSNYSERSFKEKEVKLKTLKNDNIKIETSVYNDPKDIISHINEPKTLVEERNKDEKIFNFFVDLLETTFSVYNVKTDFAANANSSSKIDLVIDENVAKKLNLQNDDIPDMYDDVTQKPSQPYYCIKQDDNLFQFQTEPIFSEQPKPEVPLKPATKYRKRNKTDSFIYGRKPQTQALPKVQSLVTPSSKLNKKNKKRTLLNILKEQLKMDDEAFEEPQNLYQALKIIARNKKKCQKTIHFDHRTTNSGNDEECTFKRRKLLSRKPKYVNDEPLQLQVITPKYSELNNYKKRTEYNDYPNESYHSLEVYGYDYEISTPKKYKKPKNIVLNYHSSPSISYLDLNSSNHVLDMSESNIEMEKQIQSHVLTSISRLYKY